MAQPQLRGRLERRRESLERSVGEQRVRGLQLRAGGAALADEVRVVGVREPVRLGPQPGDERALLERQHGLGRARHREVRLDRIPALRVRGGVGLAVDHAHPHARGGGHAADERSAAVQRRPHLQVRRARPAQRARAEEGAPQIRRAAAGPRDDAPGRSVERKAVAAEDACLGQHLDRVRRSVDQQLRARAPIEGVAAIRADLRVDAEAPEDREGPPCDGRLRDVEMEGQLPAPEEVDRAGGVEQRRDLREPVAAALGDDRRELGARVGRERDGAHRRVPSRASRRRFRPWPEAP